MSPPGSSTRRRHRNGLEYSYHRDGRGARVGAPTDSTPPSADLVFVGGSFTLGRGVEHEETFAAIVARELGRSVANLGTGAYGTVQSLLLLERHADLSPDVVVYAFIEDHLRRNLSPCAPSLLPFCAHVPRVDFDERGAPLIRPPGAGAAADWARNERFYAAVTSAPASGASLAAGFELLLERARRRLARSPPSPASDPRKRRESMRYLVHRMREATERMGARLVVAWIPDLREPDPGSRPPPTELRGALQPGVELVDIARTLRERRGRDEPLALPGDSHPSAAGHREIARGLLEHLRATGTGGARAGTPKAPS